MRQAKIIRVENNMQWGSFGVLLLDGQAFCVTLERPDQGNLPNVSCIPTGTYQCVKVHSTHFGVDLFAVQNVPGRENIEIHFGNVDTDSLGCILLGSEFGTVNNQPAICGSRVAFDKFMAAANGDGAMELTILNAF
jgi:Family of unknown function (DUF5675)